MPAKYWQAANHAIDWLSPSLNLLERISTMQTTLITGASSGIGLELAHLFAAGGNNLVLVARREERLNQLTEEVKAKHQVQATVIVQDLARTDGVDQLVNSLERRKVEIDTLVNNAGFGALGRLCRTARKTSD